MGAFLLLFLLFLNIFVAAMPRPLFALSGDVAISAFVPGETYAATTFNFSSGGTFTFNTIQTGNTVSFTFPPDFYNETLQLQTNSHSKTFFATNKPAPSGKSFLGKTYDFDLFTASNSQVTAVNRAITISFTYTDADVSGLDESTIAPYRFGSSDSSWQLISGSTVDTANNTVTFSTTLFGSFALLAAPAQAPPPPAPSPASSSGGRGGGGGSGYVTPVKSVVFSGRAYPLSKVVVLKDGQIAVSTIAGPDSRFEVSVTGLATGNYLFAVYGEDSKGIRSNLFTFSSYIASGATTKVGGIFIAPTIAVDKNEVKRGEHIAIFGQSVPMAEITIAVHSKEDFFVKTVADKDGVYLHNFDTAALIMGQHLTKSKAALDGEISSFSKAIGFIVGTKNVFAQPVKILKGDLNNDGRVNLVDFSIAAYWYKRPFSAAFSVQEKEKSNGDGKVDLVDFSIIAFYWTG